MSSTLQRQQHASKNPDSFTGEAWMYTPQMAQPSPAKLLVSKGGVDVIFIATVDDAKFVFVHDPFGDKTNNAQRIKR